MKKILILLLMVVLPACEDDSVTFQKEYFPLHIGDSWEFVVPRQDPPMYTVKREITKTVTLKGRQYYLMISQSMANALPIDTTYYRIDRKGYVYMLRNNQDREANPFRLAAHDGASWKYGAVFQPGSEGTMSLHQFTTVQLDETSVDSCKVFSYDVEEMVDEEYFITLGPGLGIVSEGSYGWGHHVLKKAVIDGKMFEF